ncbi:HIRAN domain-containing protein [Flavobacterium franklandianum]|uniref:Hiran domain protein n=1 Tax=Flavobacterium franklandianum TaxID=2594430 RepID=A0A553CRH2_9FLAO|nr:HIRAN domain-containing protein [Flavobacterium franklandianum]TRX23045.1 hiran domain protein [Flavobacterium franklandianum]
MNRLDFFRTLGLGTTGLIIPNTTWSQKPVKIYDNYVKGLTHYQFGKIRNQLVVGQELVLNREIKNYYDSFAVEVFFGSHKLGYLAAYENIAIANMLEQGVNFKAFVSKLTSNPDQVFDGLAIEIYTNIILENPKIIETDLLGKRADDAHDQYRKGFSL